MRGLTRVAALPAGAGARQRLPARRCSPPPRAGAARPAPPAGRPARSSASPCSSRPATRRRRCRRPWPRWARSSYPVRPWRRSSMADNCRDATAHGRGGAGATVWERHGGDAEGRAPRWRGASPGCSRSGRVSTPSCRRRGLHGRAEPARGSRGAPARRAPRRCRSTTRSRTRDASWTAALRYASLALMNLVRPLGKARAGAVGRAVRHGHGVQPGAARRGDPGRPLARRGPGVPPPARGGGRARRVRPRDPRAVRHAHDARAIRQPTAALGRRARWR